MRILLLSRYTRLGASSRLRSYQYLPFLQKNGIRVEASPLFDDDYLHRLYRGEKKNARKILSAYLARILQLIQSESYDLLWIEYELFPWLPAFFEKLLRLWGKPYVVDYDDAVFHRYDQSPNVLIRILLRNKIDRIMRFSSLTLAGNAYLFERARQARAQRIELLPTVIDLKRYHMASRQKSKTFNIGWIGSPTTAEYLYALQPVLSRLCEDPDTMVTLVGAGIQKMKGLRLRSVPWTEAAEVELLHTFDVGIMPLPDTLWTKGKCGYKLIQYMACGCPVVAANVGANRDIVQNGVNGYLASSPVEWEDYLKRLRKDPDLRGNLGRQGRKTVEKKYCVQVTAPRLLELLKSV